MKLDFRCLASRSETDVDAAFLSNRAGAALGSVAARGDTDLHVTGAPHAVHALLTTTPVRLAIPLNAAAIDARVDDEGALHVSDRVRVNATASRTALSISGIVVDSMSGQGSVQMDVLVKYHGGSVPVHYSNFAELSATVQLHDIEFVDSETDVAFETVVFDEDEAFDASAKGAAEGLMDIYNQGTKNRQLVVFQPAAGLTKAVMAVPFGIDGSNYDLSCSVVARPPSMSRAAFEAMAERVLGLELDFDSEKIDAFLSDCAAPGLRAAEHAATVAAAMSLFAASVCPYRIDGRTVAMPDGLKFVASESWKAEASRTYFQSCDDCDGSAAHVTAALHDAAVVAASPELASMYPFVAAFANAVSMHFVGVAVLAANAGNAEAAGENGASALAGHAIALLVPRSMILSGLLTASAGISGSSAPYIAELQSVFVAGMFTAEERERLSETDRALITDHKSFLNQHKTHQLTSLAIEGTSPVSPATLFEADPAARIRRSRNAMRDGEIGTLIGPTIARDVTSLDVGEAGDDHKFYSSFVEFLLSTTSAPFLDAGLRSKNMATAQFVFVKATKPKDAGVEPRDLSVGNFGVVPLWKLGHDMARDLDKACAEVQRNTMPMRAGPTILTADETTRYMAAVERVKRLSSVGSDAENAARAQAILPNAALVNNPNAVEALCTRVEALSGKVGVHLDALPVANCVLSSDGADIGVFLVLNFVKL